MPGRSPDDVVARVVLLTQMLPSVTPEAVRTAFSQFGRVRRVVMIRDPLQPSSNLITWAGASALLEMDSADLAKEVVKELAEKLFIVGVGPRAVQAQPASLAMLQPQDWPEAFPKDEGSGRRRMRLVDMSSPSASADAEVAAALAAAGLEGPEGKQECKRRKLVAKQHAEELALLQERLIAEHREFHEKQLRFLDKELQKVRLSQEAAEGGPVSILASYYEHNGGANNDFGG